MRCISLGTLSADVGAADLSQEEMVEAMVGVVGVLGWYFGGFGEI
jgi:hypothetical protein